MSGETDPNTLLRSMQPIPNQDGYVLGSIIHQDIQYMELFYE